MYGIDDGSYILVDNKETYLYGEGYLLKNGKIKKINDDNELLSIIGIAELKKLALSL